MHAALMTTCSIRFTQHRWSQLLGAMLLAMVATSAPALTFRVGVAGDAACTHTFAAAVSAANGNPGKDFILLSGHATGVAVSIEDELEIGGGYASCNAASPQAGVRHRLEGNSISSVLEVTAGDGLTLRQVEIRSGGNTSLLAGGGIWKIGSGIVSIYDSDIRNNTAQLGGGIAITGAGGMVLLYKGTRVQSNQANRGGGIYVDEAALRMDIADVAVQFNTALLGSNNGERAGGGIYATGTTARPAEVSSSSLTYEVFLPYPTLSGLRINGNIAHDGGGIYANDKASVMLRETMIQGNVANRYGGGVYLFGADFQMLRHPTFAPWPIICPGLLGCSGLVQNSATWAGGAISLWNGARAYIGQTRISGNTARDNIIDSYTQSFVSNLTNRLTIESSLIVSNDCTATSGSCATLRLSNTNNQSRTVLRHVVFADNRMTGGAVARAEISIGAELEPATQVNVYSSIIEPQPGNGMVDGNQPSGVRMDCVLGPGPFFATATRALQGSGPYRFINRSQFDYRPADADIAQDACDGSAIPPDAMLVAGGDLIGFGIDDPDVSNRLGAASTHDLGAFEMSPLLRNGFE